MKHLSQKARNLSRVNMLLESRSPENPGGYSHTLRIHSHECLPDLGLGMI